MLINWQYGRLNANNITSSKYADDARAAIRQVLFQFYEATANNKYICRVAALFVEPIPGL